MSSAAYDVAVVGAGIIGSATAGEIAKRGRSVVLVEAVDVASDTSCRAMGHVGVYDDSPEQLALTHFARRLWDEAEPSVAPEVDFVRRGALWVARSADDFAEVERKVEVYRRAGVEASVVDARRLHELEPNLDPGLAGALWVPGDIVLDAAEATRWLARQAVAAGVTLRTHAPVRALADGAVELESGEQIPAAEIVLATGWQAPRLLPDLPIRPRKGHIALLGPAPGFLRHQVSEVGYVRESAPAQAESIVFSLQPRSNGMYLLGATRQYVGAGTDVDPRVIERLFRRAKEYLPGIGALRVDRTWAGLRPAGPDAVPIIGRYPGRPGLVVAVAHEGIGITTSIATGRLVAELIDGAPPSIPLEPFRPERFATGAR
ncbi:MAG TPA: FAD-dependent oxidoreductase [Thermoplasmata archaeon]|nr:FAD-dependent oxidoreductase [Thermoplasmata archaeon]